MLLYFLYNDYIVCSGFTAILGDLLDKLDIPNIETGVEINMSSSKAIAQLKKKYDWNNLSASDKYKLVSEQMNFMIKSILGNYIINKFNNNIDGETILSAVKVIYNGVYENGIRKSELDKIMKANNDHNIFEFGDSIFKEKNK